LELIKELYYDARPNKSQEMPPDICALSTCIHKNLVLREMWRKVCN